MKLTANILHRELAEYYYQFRGVTTPKNSYTEDMWRQIERLESNE